MGVGREKKVSVFAGFDQKQMHLTYRRIMVLIVFLALEKLGGMEKLNKSV